MLYWLQKKFGFSKKELRGIAVLLLLIAVSWLIPVIYEACYEPSAVYFESVKAAERALTPSEKEGPPPSPVYFPFDPNKLAAAEWEKLGLHSGQIKNIKNFEAKGGKFYKKEDLLKLYTISADDYKRLEPFIRIKQNQQQEVADRHKKDAMVTRKYQTPSQSQEDSSARLELNTADSTSLLALPGIGPVFASRIVRYRNLLGGFHTIAQLQEVYGMDSLRYQQLLPMLHLDEEKIIRIALNTAGPELLRKHPYIKDKYARVIVQYRKQHGAFKRLEDLLEIALIDSDYLRKIAPYLMIDND